MPASTGAVVAADTVTNADTPAAATTVAAAAVTAAKAPASTKADPETPNADAQVKPAAAETAAAENKDEDEDEGEVMTIEPRQIAEPGTAAAGGTKLPTGLDLVDKCELGCTDL